MPRAKYSEHQKDEAMKLLKEMEDPLSGVTLGSITEKTGISYNTLKRWTETNSHGKASESRKSNGSMKSRTDYKTNYEIERLRNQYMLQGLNADEEARAELESAFLRELLQEVFGYPVAPLFTPVATDAEVPKRRGRKARVSRKDA